MESKKKVNYNCPRCHKLMVEPAKTECGHYHCLPCLNILLRSYFPFCSPCAAKRHIGSSVNPPEIDVKMQEEIKAANKDMFLARMEEVKSQRGFKLKVIFGNDHKEIKGTGQNNHEWCVFVRLANKDEDISNYITKVTFELHPTFLDPIIVKTKAPFEHTAIGWGTFNIPITIKWNPGLGLEATKVEHMLSFDGNGDASTFEIIADKTKLMKAADYDYDASPNWCQKLARW